MNTFKSIATEWDQSQRGNKRLIHRKKNYHINFAIDDSSLVINPNLPYLRACSEEIIT